MYLSAAATATFGAETFETDTFETEATATDNGGVGHEALDQGRGRKRVAQQEEAMDNPLTKQVLVPAVP